METATQPIALITGATAGIGEACAEALAAAGYDLVLTGRRADRLEDVGKRIVANHAVRVLPICFDVRDRAATAAAWESLPAAWKRIDLLVNNAGLALGRSPIHEGDVEDWEVMIDTNLKGLLYITRLVTPGMVERKAGHVINIGSVAGKEAYVNGNVYCATKFAVEGLSRGMRLDLAPFGIRVSTISPGMVDTEFSLVRFKGDSDKAAKVYEGLEPLVAPDIANLVAFVATQPAHVCINDIHVTCTAQAAPYLIVRKEG